MANHTAGVCMYPSALRQCTTIWNQATSLLPNTCASCSNASLAATPLKRWLGLAECMARMICVVQPFEARLNLLSQATFACASAAVWQACFIYFGKDLPSLGRARCYKNLHGAINSTTDCRAAKTHHGVDHRRFCSVDSRRCYEAPKQRLYTRYSAKVNGNTCSQQHPVRSVLCSCLAQSHQEPQSETSCNSRRTLSDVLFKAPRLYHHQRSYQPCRLGAYDSDLGHCCRSIQQ